MNTMAPTSPAELHVWRDVEVDMMTRRQVASLFRVTSAAVATWARRGRLPEFRNHDGRPRYRRADVEELLESGTRRKTR
jgi:predicted site-specific integrase-resolvase